MNALDRLIKARANLIQDAPFFGSLALHLELVENAACGTMATDGAHLFYAPSYVDKLDNAEILTVVAEEVLHNAYGHPARIGARDLKLANRAADYAINRDLKELGFKLPKDALLSDEFDSSMSMEEIYSVLASRQSQSQKPQPGQGQPGAPDQSGAGKPQDGRGDAAGQSGQPGAQSSPTGAPAGLDGQGKPGATGDADTNGTGGILKPGDGTKAASDAMADQWQVLARQAASVAAKQAGSMPGAFKRILDDISTPAVDYRDVFADLIDSRIASDYSFSRPNRRYIHAGFYLPGVTVDALDHLVFVVDTSGSITDQMAANATAEIQGALDGGKVDRVTVMHVDTRVAWHASYTRGDTIDATVHGKGGTRFSPAFDWIARNVSDATAIVYLTDMECHDFGREPDAPLVWAIHGDSRRFDQLATRAPFGDSVYVGRLA